MCHRPWVEGGVISNFSSYCKGDRDTDGLRKVWNVAPGIIHPATSMLYNPSDRPFTRTDFAITIGTYIPLENSPEPSKVRTVPSHPAHRATRMLNPSSYFALGDYS